jgi:hypothetical protein
VPVCLFAGLGGQCLGISDLRPALAVEPIKRDGRDYKRSGASAAASLINTGYRP